MIRWNGGWILALALALLLGGCDRSPSGEGEWTGTLEGPGGPFGAVVLMISGEGVLGVSGAGGTLAWTEETDEGEFRAVLIQSSPSGGARFRVRVREIADPAPAIAIIQLAGTDDELLTPGGQHYIRMRR